MSETRITTPFGPTSTAAAIVTGVSSGIGQETARVLAGAVLARRGARRIRR